MAKQCPVTGKKYNKAYTVSFSHKRSIKRQHANLQSKRLWDPDNKRWIRLVLSTSAIKMISKKGAKRVLALALKKKK